MVTYSLQDTTYCVFIKNSISYRCSKNEKGKRSESVAAPATVCSYFAYIPLKFYNTLGRKQKRICKPGDLPV